MNKNVYSVGQVNSYIKNMFAQDFMLHHISIKGEVSNCKYHSSGHIYFTLKDSAGAISAIMFAGNRKGLKFTMKEGDQVIVTGSVEVYEKTGDYQIYAREIDLAGAGNLFLKFEALKRELEEMGMFSDVYKRAIPKYATRIGIVTAPTGAAIQDIRNIAYRRNPFVQLILYPALVQGEGAAASIVNGIRALDRLGLDIIIVGRGGGSIEDLWAFNEEPVARAIFDCQTPVISAVGHETDWTIADFVADKRASTPSAAAEIAVFEYGVIKDKIAQYDKSLNNILLNKINIYREKLKYFSNSLKYLSPANKLNDNRRKLLEYDNQIRFLMDEKIRNRRNQLSLLASRLDGLSPAKKLSQGYSYVETADGKPPKSVKEVSSNDELLIYMRDGKVLTKVLEVTENE